MLKVVLDTNGFVSSLLIRAGLPAQVVNAWRERRYLLVTSPSIVAEIRATLSYPRIRRKYAIPNEDIEQLVLLLEHDALLVLGEFDTAGAVPDDAADEMVLACAVEAEADLIVSGDRHLLDLTAFEGIPILTVRQFLERLRDLP